MGVDIYVGTLTRYYARDWQTILQQTMPTKMHYFGKNAPKEGETLSQAEVLPLVSAWRAQIAQFTKEHIPGDWNWDESPEVPYWTDKPGWYGHNALRAVALDPRSDRKKKIDKIPQYLPGEWGKLKISATATDYRHVIWPQWWVPLSFAHMFTVPGVGNEPRTIGSIDRLIAELRRLNEATIGADAQKLEWYRRANEFPEKLEDWLIEQAFGFGLAMLMGLAEQAQRNRLPMLLDW